MSKGVVRKLGLIRGLEKGFEEARVTVPPGEGARGVSGKDEDKIGGLTRGWGDQGCDEGHEAACGWYCYARV